MIDPARRADLVAELRASVRAPGTRADPLYTWLAYHLGWADADGRPAEARTGKGVRPAICLVACQAVGGDPSAALPAAAAIELTHEFSLVHDDIEDGDRLRRGRPALWTLIGVEQAINAGDALWAIARRRLSDTRAGEGTVLDMMRRYDTACLALAEGQYLDLVFESANDVDIDTYLAMVSRKTGALFGAAAALGALAGGAPAALAGRLERYGLALGIAFQIQDDILGLWGSAGTTGKPAGRDLERRKKSLPVILGLSEPRIGAEIAAYYGSAQREAGRAAELAERMADAGLRDRSVAVAHHWRDTATAALDTEELVAEPRAALEALARESVERVQ